MSAPGRIGICTDSAAQLPADLIERFGVEVVPITVSIDGEDYLEGIDLQVDDVTARGCAPRNGGDGGDGGDGGEVRTSQPSPGQYALAYEQLLERGCTEILSLHGPAPDGPTSCSSARLAARQLDAPVRVVDTGAVGFALGCCVWAAGEAIARGASIDEAAAAAESLSGGRVGNLFVVDALGSQPGRRIQVLTGSPGDGARGARGAVDVVVEVVVEVDTVLEAVNEIAAAVVGWGHDLLVGIGHADDAAAPVADALASAVGETAAVREVVRYRVSASSAARTGAGTVTCFAFTGGVTPSSANVPSTPAAS